MKYLYKYLLVGFVIALFAITPVFAQEEALPDLYVEDLSFIECDQWAYDVANIELGDPELLNVADDGTYFDAQRIPTEDFNYTAGIRRTLCVIYTIGINGTVPIGETDTLWEDFFVTDQNETFRDMNHGHIGFHDIGPGESYTDTSTFEVYLNKYSQKDSYCVGIAAL
ncbi:MAG: hypothetical protein IH975_07225, partial [Nitrospinae bacterium]|nr:hypothetical protein [Nitrospinota bacterium]